jgi:phenylacetaldehyde dehydrogenase
MTVTVDQTVEQFTATPRQLMAAWKLGPALTTGNTVVLKPAEQTPLTAVRLAGLLAEAGVPDGVVNVVTGFGDTAGAALAAHPMVDKVAFTGSTEVGKLIVQAASGNLKKVTLELGGKSPNIVFDDAPEDAVAGAVNAIFFNHGQCCVAGSRLFVQEDRFDEVVSGVSEIAKSIKLGPGMEEGTQMGPLVSDEQLRRVTGYLESGRSDGATALTGGGRFGDKGYFVEPTVITNTRPDMKIVREEIFGPVVVAAPFQSLDDIAVAANDSEYGLGAGIWTQDISKAHALAKKLGPRDGPPGPGGLHRGQGRHRPAVKRLDAMRQGPRPAGAAPVRVTATGPCPRSLPAGLPGSRTWSPGNAAGPRARPRGRCRTA